MPAQLEVIRWDLTRDQAKLVSRALDGAIMHEHVVTGESHSTDQVAWRSLRQDLNKLTELPKVVDMGYFPCWFDANMEHQPVELAAGPRWCATYRIRESTPIKRWLDVETNNQAEWQALIDLLTEIEAYEYSMQALSFEIFGDSQLVIKQMTGEYKVKDAKLRELHDIAADKVASIRLRGGSVKFTWIPREENNKHLGLPN